MIGATQWCDCWEKQKDKTAKQWRKSSRKIAVEKLQLKVAIILCNDHENFCSDAKQTIDVFDFVQQIWFQTALEND